jgi:ABC-type polysaccharide transport system permease subunit
MFIYFKLANPSSTNPVAFTDFKDFLKKTKNILVCIVTSIFKFLLVVILIPIIINRLVSDANKEKAERLIETYELYKEQYLSITGTLEAIKSLDLIRQMASSL